ncbi:alpha/beta hydrolase [Kribbella sp. NBC_01245]|uniref:alpha/beta fold hydrolase n=1 Tax=Kribbella sp. NBC_01245 TaxID=2903578 RepID=UPI002E2D5C86|nr:alpha/beta hydrolase [Kribbella sp. NBC_01245]
MRLDVDDLPLHYEVYGDGRPIVFLPRWGDQLSENRDLHEPVFANRPGWQRIYLDPPGHGQTPGRPWIKGLEGFQEVVQRFVDEVVGDRRFVLAGASAGSLMARGVLRDRFDRVDGVLLRVPGVILDPEQRTLPPEQPGVLDSETYQAAYKLKKDQYYDPAEQAADLDFLASVTGDLGKSTYNVDNLSRPFEAPALIVAGRQDTATGYVDPWRLLPDYPRATYVVLDRADHDLPVLQDALYHALVADWLNRIEEP